MGGCLNTGFNLVPLNSLYHRILVKALQATLEAPVQVRLGRMESSQMAVMQEQALALLDESQADLLIVQLRPEMLWGLFSQVWLARSGSGLARLRRNPHAQYGPRWPVGLEEGLTPMMNRFHVPNLWLGRICGLEHTGLALLTGLITAVRDAARARGAELVLFSPIFGEIYHPTFRRYVAKRILPVLGQLEVAIIDLLGSPALGEPSCWVGDGYHLNANGHQEVARLTQATVEPILRARLAQTETDG